MNTRADNDPSPPRRKIYRDPNLQIVFGVTLMAIMGVTSITPAFPLIARELAVSPEDIGRLITYFTFPGVFLTPILGILADRAGRKVILVPSLMLFGVAGGACTFVHDFDVLLVLRVFQGVGAASLGALNVTIMGDLFTGTDRTSAMGYNASVLSVGTAAYPVIGGALATIAWFYPFALAFLAIPIGLVVLFSLKNPEPKSEEHIAEYMANIWQNLKNRQIMGLLVAGLVTFTILYGSYLTYFPFLIEHAFGGAPVVIGLIMSASSLATALTAARLGSFVRRYSESALLKAGYVLFALSLALVPFMGSIWLLLVPAVLFGIATGINIPNILTLLTGLSPMRQRGAVMAINGTVFRLGQTLGPMVMAGVVSAWNLQGTFFAGALLSLAMFGFAVVVIRQDFQ